MWSSTKIKREQRRLDDMVTNVGMPPSWEAIGRDKKGWVYRWRNGDSFVEHRGGSWFWYTGIKTKHFTENGAFTCPVACAVACETPIAAIAEYTLIGENTPMKAPLLDDVFGEVLGMTKLDHTSERKPCEKELVNMPGKWRVVRKNNRFEFRLSITPGKRFFVIQYRTTKPAGWVVFEVKQQKRYGSSPRQSWTSRKKVSDVSYPSPGAAAAAVTVANLIPAGS